MEGSSKKRFKEIVRVLTNYGFGYMMDKKNKESKKSPAKLRIAFEELGATFIKMGQILSTRADLIDVEYLEELSKLQDNVPLQDFDEMNKVFYEEFSQNIDDIFEYIDKKPLASASIAQVYKGILKDGRQVVLKIQRPNIKDKMIMDFDILISLSERFKGLLKDSIVEPKDVLREVRDTTLRELDFKLEAQNIQRFKDLNDELGCVYAPFIVEELSREKVLTLENIDGFKINDIRAIIEHGYDEEDIAKKFALSYFKQVLKDGFFHGDPHPGNLLIRDGKICFLDFGIVGVLSDDLKNRLNEVIDALANEDIDKITDFVIGIGIKNGRVERSRLYDDVAYLFNNYFSTSLKNIKLSILLQEVIETTKKNNLRLPSEFTSLVRCMVMVEGLVAELAPEINIITLVVDYVKDIHKQYLLSKLDMDEILFKAYGLYRDILKSPSKLVQLIDTISKGRLKINFKLEDINKYMESLNKMVNRLAFAIVVGAMVIASSIIINRNHGPKLYGVSIIGLGGYFVSAILGLWLLISIIRSGSLK